MLRELKQLVNPWMLARQNRQFSGRIPVAAMPRLVEQLATDQPCDQSSDQSSDGGAGQVSSRGSSRDGEQTEIDYSIQFRNQPVSLGLTGGDDAGSAQAEIAVAGQVKMTCQRSLRDFWVPVEHRSLVAFFDDEAAMERCPEDCEPVLVDGGQLPLIQLLEDEMILALPVVAIDPTAQLPGHHASAGAEQGHLQAPDPEQHDRSGNEHVNEHVNEHEAVIDHAQGGAPEGRPEQGQDDPDEKQRPFADLARLMRDEKFKEK